MYVYIFFVKFWCCQPDIIVNDIPVLIYAL